MTTTESEHTMSESQRMVGALCEGCDKGSSSKLGTVTQRDLGSADKWHGGCYRRFMKGQRDRIEGNGCLSANGQYLNGWYSVPCGVTKVTGNDGGASWSVRCTICQIAPMHNLSHVGAVNMAKTHNATHGKDAQ